MLNEFFKAIGPEIQRPGERPYPDYHLQSPLNLERFHMSLSRSQHHKSQLKAISAATSARLVMTKDDIIKGWARFCQESWQTQFGKKEMDWPKMSDDLKNAVSQYVSGVTMGSQSDNGDLINHLLDALNGSTGGSHITPLNTLSCILRRFVEWRNHFVTTPDSNYPIKRLQECDIVSKTHQVSGTKYLQWSFCCHHHLSQRIEGKPNSWCNKPKLTLMVTPDIFAFGVHDKEVFITPFEFLLCWADTLESRVLMYRLSNLEHDIVGDVLSSEELDTLYSIFDDILFLKGNDGYSVIKLLEPLCLGEVQSRLNRKHGLEDNDTFYDTMKSELMEECCCHEQKIVATRLLEFLQGLSSVKVLEVFGTFRHWGHPFLEVRKGLENLKSNARKVKVIDAEVMRELQADCEQILLHHYYSRFNSWPNDAHVPWVVSPILANCICKNRWPTLDERRRIGLGWLYVTHGPLFDIPDIIPVDILIDDKAHSGNRSEVERLIKLAKSGKLVSTSKRVILTTLRSQQMDIRRELSQIDLNGFPDDDLIIGLKGKERELKVEGRFFSLMSFRLRLYFVATEWMLGKYILPLFSEITMMDSGPELMRKLSEYTKGSYDPKDRKTVTFSIHLDYSKWNAHQRYESTVHVFKVIDQALGYQNLISSTHKIFEKCVYYYADALTSINKLGADEEYTWSNHLGGIEGLRQKGWSIVGALLLRKVGREFNQPFSLLIQGDNQVVVLKYETELIPEDPDYKREINRLLALTKSILEHICEISNRIGLITKKEETWVAYGLLIYGKYPILEGIGIGMYSKRVSRMYTSSNEKIPSLQNTLSTISTAGLTIAQLTSSILVPMALTYYMMFIATQRFMSYDPCLGEGIMRLLSAPLTIDGVHMVPKVSNLDALLFDILTRDTVLGGLGGGSPARFLVRQFPDPLNESLAAIKAGAEKLPPVFKNVLIRQGYPVISSERNWKNLLEDPTSLNLYSGSNIRTVIRSIVTKSMSSGVNTWIKEPALKEALSLRDKSEDEVIQTLVSWEPMLPNLLCNMYEASLLGQVNGLINRFDGTRTLVDKAFAESNGFIHRRIRGAYKKSLAVYRIHFDQEGKEVKMWDCSYEHSLMLQLESWGKVLYGVRVPHPIEQFDLIAQDSGNCQDCDAKDLKSEKILFLLNNKVLRCPSSINSLGPGTAYLGSSTTEHKATLKQVAAKSTETIVQRALAVTKCLNWFVSPNSSVAKSVMNLISSLCDYPVEKFPLPAPKTSGDVLHRYSSSRMAHGGFAPISYGPLTNVYQNSNLLQSLQRGGENRLIVFQAVFISMSIILITRVQCGISPSPAYHAHPKCMSCFPVCEKIWIDNDQALVAEWPTTKGADGVTVFYARGGENLITSVPRALIQSIRWEQTPKLVRQRWVYFTLAYLITEDYWQSPYHDVQVGSIYTAPLVRHLNYVLWVKYICIVLILKETWITSRNQGDQIAISFENLRYRALEKLPSFSLPLSALTHCHDETFLCQMRSHSGLTPRSYPPKTEEILSICQADIATTLRDLTSIDILEEFPEIDPGPYIFQDVNEWSYTQRLIVCLTFLITHLNTGQNVTLYHSSINEIFTQHKTQVPWVTDSMYQSVQTILNHCRPFLFDVRFKDVAEDFLLSDDLAPFRGISSPERTVRFKASYLMSRGMRPDPMLSVIPPKMVTTPLSHFVRQSSGTTTADSKLKSLLHLLPKNSGGWIVCGDGSGGFTAIMARCGFVEYIIFNTLPDYQGAGEQSLGSAIPPALLNVTPTERRKIINLEKILEVDQDLRYQKVYQYWLMLIQKQSVPLVGLLCDAETYDDHGWLNIFRNILRFQQETNSMFTLLIKGHLIQIKRLIDKELLTPEELSGFDFIRSPYSQWGNTEIYLHNSPDGVLSDGPHLHLLTMMIQKCNGIPRVQLSTFHQSVKLPYECRNRHQVATMWSRLLKDLGVRSHKVIYPKEYSLVPCLAMLYIWAYVGYLSEVRQYRQVGSIAKIQGLHLSDIHYLCGLQCSMTCLMAALIGDYTTYQEYVEKWDIGMTRYDPWEYSGGLVGILQRSTGSRETRWQRKKPTLRALMNILGMLSRPELSDRDAVRHLIKNNLKTYSIPSMDDIRCIPVADRGFLKLLSER